MNHILLLNNGRQQVVVGTCTSGVVLFAQCIMELEVKYYFRCKNVGADGSHSEGFIVCAYVRISIFPLALEMVTSFVTRILIMLCFMLEKPVCFSGDTTRTNMFVLFCFMNIRFWFQVMNTEECYKINCLE